MPIEIERKFLVRNDNWRLIAAPGRRFCQGYVAKSGGTTVRVRRAEEVAFVTIKGERDGIARPEYEYEIPIEEAEEMLANLCMRPLLEKVRHRVPAHGVTWEIDVFQGAAAGLVVAEVELERTDQAITLPDWIGIEVTHDLRYRNASIAELGPPE